jgi:hypothetical protein
MGMEMESLRRISVYIFLLGAPLLGQTRLETGGTLPAASGPAFDASLGYVNLDMAEPSIPLAILNGVNADGLVRFTPRWGATVDSTFARSGNVRSTGHSDDVLSGLAGPVFYPVAKRNNGVFVHVLAGAAWVEGAVPVNGTYYLSGQQTHFFVCRRRRGGARPLQTVCGSRRRRLPAHDVCERKRRNATGKLFPFDHRHRLSFRKPME